VDTVVYGELATPVAARKLLFPSGSEAKKRRVEMTKFKDFIKEIEEEAKKEGTEAIKQIKALRDFFAKKVKELLK
jgi:hypothetical protein